MKIGNNLDYNIGKLYKDYEGKEGFLFFKSKILEFIKDKKDIKLGICGLCDSKDFDIACFSSETCVNKKIEILKKYKIL